MQRPVLIGKAFDPELHRSLTREEVGEDFERRDLVFVGTYEKERRASINRLARRGMSVVVYGNGWRRSVLAPEVDLRPQQLALDYTRAMHTGKVALCFLRKINRDRITRRTMEIAAMADRCWVKGRMSMMSISSTAWSTWDSSTMTRLLRRRGCCWATAVFALASPPPARTAV